MAVIWRSGFWLASSPGMTGQAVYQQQLRLQQLCQQLQLQLRRLRFLYNAQGSANLSTSDAFALE